jgi:sulfide:quinone oxidoreductase
MPSFPLDPRVPRRMNWWLKRYYLPKLYWRMVSTGLGPDWHRKRTFAEALPPLAA